jgi:lysophospholipase L1-like esterase
VIVQSPDGNATVVIYDPPSIIAGEPPLRIGCTPPSGSLFALGTSTITCSVTDSALRANSCAFTVTVTPRLSATNFVAFGNSITEGKSPSGDLQKSYPENLRELLTARYVLQTFVVVNAGCGGEFTIAASSSTCTGGVIRLPEVLDSLRPEVVLLEEGINDLNDGGTSAIAGMIDGLRTMIHEAKDRGVRVFVATLPPEREGGSRATAFAALPTANDQIRILASNEQVPLVDLFNGFGGTADPYIDVDGLHPTEQGYQKMAQLFFDAIRTALEMTPGAATTMDLARNMSSRNVPLARRR